MDGFLEFLEGNGHLVARRTELRVVRVLHAHVEAAPDDDAAEDADDDHLQHRALWRVEQAADEALLRWTFLPLVILRHPSSPFAMA